LLRELRWGQAEEEEINIDKRLIEVDRGREIE
jgi:hypothetical protein